MTQIDFYTNAEDKLVTACRLALKAYSLGHRIVALCPKREMAQRLDRMLWSAPATGFVPHCAADDPLAAVTPVLLDDGRAEPIHDEVLLNLGDNWPPYFARFERLIEIVDTSDSDKERARGRYKFYRDRGYHIRVHDLGDAAAARGAA